MREKMAPNRTEKPTENRLKKLCFEFLRYAVVGGISFLADAGSMALVKELFFKEDCSSLEMALCVAVGFCVGLLVNYALSTLFVFCGEGQKRRGRSLGAFLIYAAVGVIGFFLTELGMWIGVGIVGSDGFWYLAVKCLVAGVVLVWNYAGRKIFVYHGE